jgi:hypothetical protein
MMAKFAEGWLIGSVSQEKETEFAKSVPFFNMKNMATSARNTFVGYSGLQNLFLLPLPNGFSLG